MIFKLKIKRETKATQTRTSRMKSLFLLSSNFIPVKRKPDLAKLMTNSTTN